jgi:hypothetical protein
VVGPTAVDVALAAVTDAGGEALVVGRIVDGTGRVRLDGRS